VRTGRRTRQDRAAGQGSIEGLDALQERDRQDSSRAVAPLVLGDGVTRIDTSDLDLPQVVERVLALLQPVR
jgi:cytidylate kinase